MSPFSRFLRLLPGALVLALLLPLSASADDSFVGPLLDREPDMDTQAKGGRHGGGWQGLWEHCANEGERCRVLGSAVVRYGAEGRYAYRQVRNATIDCDNNRFGDPAPRRRKHCELRPHGGDFGGSGGNWDGGSSGGWDDVYSWERCAREGELCRVQGRSVVRYGADGRFTERSVRRGSIACTNGNFGDPAPGRRKFCDVRPEFGGVGGDAIGGLPPGQGMGPWQYCAREGDYCRPPGPAFVRYGVDGRFFVRRVDGGVIACTNGTFGDPARRETKRCDYQLLAGGGFGGDWHPCAKEGNYCRFNGIQLVRYGADGRYVVREFRDGTECSNRAFGEDPAPRRTKTCELQHR
ncbi:MAG: hypothetical protein MEQ07_08890 [Aquimonas sp.]|nr:hypothetical protein [Aquimonas sp.]